MDRAGSAVGKLDQLSALKPPIGLAEEQSEHSLLNG